MSASAAELWRWKDADGVVHYSDRPVPGAERIDVRSNQKSTGEFNPEAPPPPAARPVTPANRYTRCAVASPVNDQVFNAVRAVRVTLAIEPGLSSDHDLQVILNGSPYAGWPADSMSYTLQNLDRGSYTLAARVLDAVPPDAWDRAATRRGTERFTIELMARFSLHEVVHHHLDAERSLGS